VPEACKPQRIATWPTTNVQHPGTCPEVASDHTPIHGELERAVGWVGESTPFAFTKVCVVAAGLVVGHVPMVREAR
jgi:hypothetical protein